MLGPSETLDGDAKNVGFENTLSTLSTSSKSFGNNLTLNPIKFNLGIINLSI